MTSQTRSPSESPLSSNAPPPIAASDHPPRCFANGSYFNERFRIERPLGEGGMGVVYQAKDDSDRTVALKVMQRERARDPESRARFEREADILYRLDDPGIVKLYDFGVNDDNVPWIAMEMLDGETLRDFVGNRGPLSPIELSPILSSVASALTAAHAEGVVHRDLKPDNVFLVHEGESMVKILDFGLSMSTTSRRVTRDGSLIGTPRYMAPEQLLGATKATKQSDVYSLGVIAYEAICGESPFAASGQRQLLGAILQGKIQPRGDARPDLSGSVVRCVEKAIAANPDDRYRTPGEFERAFATAAFRAAMGEKTETTEHATQPQERDRSRLWLALFAIAAIAAIAISMYR